VTPGPRRRSLLVRLLATSMLIAICAIAATAWLTVRITTRAVADEPGRTLSADTDVYDAFIGYAAAHDRWDQVGDTVRRLASLTGRHIALTTEDRRTIADSAPGTTRPDRPSATVDPLRLDAALARSSAGRIDPRAVGPYRLTPAEHAKLRAAADGEVQCLRDGQVAAEVVETPSGRPTVRLLSADVTERSSRCAAPELRAAVPSELAPLEQLTALTQECLGEGTAAFSITPLFSLVFTTPATSADHERQALSCLEESRRAQLTPYAAPRALLFVTDPAQPVAAPVVRLSAANTARIVGMTGVVLTLALVATVLVGRRLVRPLRLLTEAARQPVDDQRPVPVTTHDEIGYLATAFNDLAERRRQLEAQRKAMVNDIAHELRTPLTNIRTWLEAARAGVTPVDPALLDLLVDESILLQHVIDDLRDLAAADAGSLRVHPEPVFVNDVLAQLLDAHRGAAEAAGVTLAAVPDGDPEATVDPVRLRQLLGNLVANAIRHTPAGGAVTVRSRRAGDRLVVEVADTGGGITAEDLPKVFERFWRADASRSRTTGGSGLGLPIARHLAEAHGGTVTVTSRLGEGSTFTVNLPLLVTAGSAPVDRARLAAAAIAGEGARRR
jgi:two-component system sensor histidine kinase BaeS